MTEPNGGTVEPWLLDAARSRMHAFATQLRSVGDTSVKVPNLEWSVADLGQHVAGLPWHFRDLHETGEGFEPPSDWAKWSIERRSSITEREAAPLADRLMSEVDAYLDELGNGPDRCWYYGFQTPPSTVVAMLANEAIMHGRDLAGVTGERPPTPTDREAQAAADATMAAMHVFVDPEKAAGQPDGVYHVKFRGGKDYTWIKSGGALTCSEGKPAKADAHLNTDAAMFMLSSLGRVGQVRAALSGKVVAYGRKPWRFLGLGAVTYGGV